jgi:SH3-like domain-containing protein
MIRGKSLLALSIMLGLLSAPAFAADEGKVPYWASIDTDVANMRVGPGNSYRIAWVYQRRNLPVRIVRREGPWRLIEDPDGARGWMRDLLLSRERSAIVRGEGLVEMHAEAKGASPMLWRLEPGVVGLLGECESGWCALDVDGHKGFVREDRLWGAGAP